MVREVSQSSSLSSGRGYEALATGLGAVGEGLWVLDSAQPLTQLRVSSKLLTLRNPLPLEREKEIQFSELNSSYHAPRNPLAFSRIST